MRPLTAWMIILGALIVGIVLGNVALRSTGSVVQLGISCLLLAEAERLGHLDARKRAMLVERVAQSPALGPNDRADAAKLKSECPKL